MTLALLTAEYYKALTLRYWWALPLGPLMFGLLASASFAWFGDSLTGYYLASGAMVAVAGLFGALTVTIEYRYGTLAPTYLSAPSRDDAIAAKMLVILGFSAAYGILTQATALPAALIAGRSQINMSWELLAAAGGGFTATVCWAVLWAGAAYLTGKLWGPAAAAAGWLVTELVIWLIATVADNPGFAGGFPAAATVSAITGGALKTALLLPGQAGVILLAAWTTAVAGGGWWLARIRDLS